MIEWIDIEDEEPQAGDIILAELNGCKLSDYIVLTVREGEGLGHIKRWALIGKDYGME